MRTVHKGLIPIYPGSLDLIFTKDLKDIEDIYNLGHAAGMNAISFTQKNIYYIAFLAGEITPAIIAHECIHIYNYIASNNGVLLSRHNDEPQAYYVKWLINRVLEACDKEDWDIMMMDLFKRWSK